MSDTNFQMNNVVFTSPHKDLAEEFRSFIVKEFVDSPHLPENLHEAKDIATVTQSVVGEHPDADSDDLEMAHVYKFEVAVDTCFLRDIEVDAIKLAARAFRRASRFETSRMIDRVRRV